MEIEAEIDFLIPVYRLQEEDSEAKPKYVSFITTLGNEPFDWKDVEPV